MTEIAAIPESEFETGCRVLREAIQNMLRNPDTKKDFEKWKKQREESRNEGNT